MGFYNVFNMQMRAVRVFVIEKYSLSIKNIVVFKDP